MKTILFILLLMFSHLSLAFDKNEYIEAVKRGDYDELYKPSPVPEYGYDITRHSNCVLENSKNAKTETALLHITVACRRKATPKKCREVSALKASENTKSPQKICAEECKIDGVWSRKYGDCSLD